MLSFLKKQNGCNALRTFCFFRREPSASGATGGRLGIRRMSMLDGYCLQQGAGVRFCCLLHGYSLKTDYYSHAYKNHDSPAAGGDQQASQTWAAGGLQVAERNGAGMERKELSKVYEAKP